MLFNIKTAIAWSAMGTSLPLAAAVLSTPFLIYYLGDARFGILTLAWVVVGYFGFLDFGLGRTVTHFVARQIGTKKEKYIRPTVNRIMGFLSIFGVLGGVVSALSSAYFISKVMKIDQLLQEEVYYSFLILSLTIPLVVVISGLRGAIEGLKRFDIVNIIRGITGAFTYLGPVMIVPFFSRLEAVICVLLFGRFLSLCCYGYAYSKLVTVLSNKEKIEPSNTAPLLKFGIWLTLSNIAGPLLLYGGRFFLVAMVSAEAVAYFSTSYELVTALLLIPGIFVSVLFPVFSSSFQGGHQGVKAKYMNWQLINAITMLPFCLIFYLFAKLIISLWISEEFAEKSFIICQILSVGVFINSFGHISQALIQSYGRPDLTAKLHLIELILFVPYTYWFVKSFGVIGAAYSWNLRVTLSTIALVAIAHYCLRQTIKTSFGDIGQSEKNNVN